MEFAQRLWSRFVLTVIAAAQIVIIAFGVSAVLTPKAATAVASVPYLINFQGRLTDNSGNILTDGSYNIKFRIWDASSGGTNRWEADRVYSASDHRITVQNGLFNIRFGDTAQGDPALSPSLFNTQTYANLYLEVELPTPATATCAINGCPVFTEGAMTPRQPLASAPYAFNSDTLDGLDSSAFVQLSPGSQQSGSINVDGSLQAATGTLSGASALTLGSTANAAAIIFNDGTANGRSITLGTTGLTSSYSLTLPTSLPGTGQCLQSDSVTASQLIFGSCSAGTTLQTAYNAASPATVTLTTGKDLSFVAPDVATDPSITFNLQCATCSAAGGRFAVQSGGTDVFKISPSGGAALFQNSTNSTTAFQIQNAGGTALLTADTTGDTGNLVTNGSFDTATTGWSAEGTASLATASASPSPVYGSAELDITTNANNDGAKYPLVLATGTQYTLNFWSRTTNTLTSQFVFGYTADGSTETGSLTNSASPATLATGNWQRYSLTFTTPGTVNAGAYLFFKQSGSAASRHIYLDGVVNEAGAVSVPYREGKLALSGLITSPTVVQGPDIASVFQVLNSTGTQVFNVDTQNNRAVVGSGSSNAKLFVAGSSTVGGTLNAAGRFTNAGAGNLLELADNGNSAITVSYEGSAAFGVTGTFSGSGTITNSAGGTTITGTSTNFLTAFKAGDTLTFTSGAAESCTISSIASNTSLTCSTITNAHTGATYTITGAGTTDSIVLGANGQVGIGTASPSASLHVAGTALFKNASNSTSAFQVQNAGSAALFTIDTTNERLYVGPTAGDTVGALLVLGNKTNAGDPTGVNGGMYYNSNAGKFRCYENGLWQDCSSGFSTITKTADQAATQSSTAMQNDNTLFFNMSANTTYIVDGWIPVDDSDTTADLQYDFTTPAGATLNLMSTYYLTATTSTQCNITVSATACAMVDTVNLSNHFIQIRGFIANGSTAGNLQFRFAQRASTAASFPVIKKGATLTWHQSN